MSERQLEKPMRIRLSESRREDLVDRLQGFFRGEFDREISEFQSGLLIDFFVKNLGAHVYNQAIQDARGALQEKLDDLEGEFYEPVDE
ncbi:MAG: DUF2164 domain-containing protein [Myxococcota bacterium]